MAGEHPCALQRNGGPAGIVVGAGRRLRGIGIIAVARIVVATHHHHAAGGHRIRPAQNCVHVGNFRGLRYSIADRLSECIYSDLEAITTIAGVALEFGFDPVTRGGNAVTAARRLRYGERTAISDADQLENSFFNLRWGNLAQGSDDGGIRFGRGRGRSFGG